MVRIGITRVVNVELPHGYIEATMLHPTVPYFQCERHRKSPSTAPHYPLGIHIGSQGVTNDWSLILMGYCGLVVVQIEAKIRI
jgi:hypothetical protein